VHPGDARHGGSRTELVANGMTVEQIVVDYPYLEPEDIYQALRYAAWMAEDSVHELERVPA
jgi:uncharacterized protein (DUF433 family)